MMSDIQVITGFLILTAEIGLQPLDQDHFLLESALYEPFKHQDYSGSGLITPKPTPLLVPVFSRLALQAGLLPGVIQQNYTNANSKETLISGSIFVLYFGNIYTLD